MRNTVWPRKLLSVSVSGGQQSMPTCCSCSGQQAADDLVGAGDRGAQGGGGGGGVDLLLSPVFSRSAPCA